MASIEEARTRKLAPIYSALESGNWRHAVRLCDMRDVEKWHTTKALKANGLWRLGKFEAALRLCHEVQTAIPTDEDTLAAMSFNYRIMNRREEVTPMFEAAVKARPSEPALVKELFMCHVRAKNYLKAQQTATKLYKLDSRGGKFIVWAAATMLIQAERKEGSAGATTLPLAERMTVKVLQEKADKGSRPVGEELRLYLDILKLQGKHREALQALERFEPASPCKTPGNQAGGIEDESSLEDGTIVNMQELERLELKAELYEKLGTEEDYVMAETVLHDLLKRLPDQWSYYMALFDLAGKRHELVASEGQDHPPRKWHDSLMAALQLIRQLQRQNPRWRGPFLAEMELLERCIRWFGSGLPLPSVEDGDAEQHENGSKQAGADPASEGIVDGGRGEGVSLSEALFGCITRYMNKFSAKLCCFQDMRPHLSFFLPDGDGAGDDELARGLDNLKAFFKQEAEQSKVLEEGGSKEPLKQEDRDAGVKRLHRYICACQARHFLRDYTASSGNPGGRGGDEEEQDGGADADSDERVERRYRDVVHELTVQYRATLHLNLGSEGGQREVQHGDELVLLAARVLLRLSLLYGEVAKRGDSSFEAKEYLVRAEVACLLEAGMSCSPYNHYMKILAIDVYRQLGSFARGITLFNELDVKQIQVDTLSYLIVGPCHSLGMFAESQVQCKGIRAVHRNCQNETSEHVARSFDRGNYSKGAEMDRFQREKLDMSLQLALAKAEKIAMDIITDHHTYISAARHLQEDVLSDDGSGVSFPGDTWLKELVENMDYTVQADRCCFRGQSQEDAMGSARRDGLLASLRRRLLANHVLLLTLKGDPPAEVDKKVKELESAVTAAASVPAAVWNRHENEKSLEKGVPNGVEGVTASLAAVDLSAEHDCMSTAPWRLMAETARALTLVHQGVGDGSSSLGSSVEAMRRGTEYAKTCRRYLKESRRHVCTLEGSASKGTQNEVPLRPAWIRAWSKWLADGGVYTCLLLQAIGSELPADKKKKGKGKGKGRGKNKSTSSVASPGGEAGGAGATSDIARVQDALSLLGGEVAGVLRGLATTLKSEVSAKGDPTCPGGTLSQLLRGGLGVPYEAAINVLWDPTGDRWCEEQTVRDAVVGVGAGQATSCQRLLGVVTQHLAGLHRWDK